MWLAIESAGAACSVALIDGEALLDERHVVVGRGHAEMLMPMVADLLAGHAIPRGIWVDCGPGSFTGVRVGLATARALGLGWNVPVFGFSSTALVAAGAFARHPGAQRVMVALIGGHGELFVEAFSAAPFESMAPLRSVRPDAIVLTDDFDVIAGSAAASVQTGSDVVQDEGEPKAADVRLLPPAARALSPGAIYGRSPDAKAATV